MANELMQGLLSSLLQPQQQQGPDPSAVMAAINSPNPMAAVMAMQAPSIGANVGGMFRQAIGGRGNIGMTAQEAMAESLGKTDLTTSAGLTQAAKNAMATGNRALALQFTLQAQELAKQEEANRQATLQQQLQTATGVASLESYMASAKTPQAKQVITGLMNAVASGALTTTQAAARAQAAINQFDKAEDRANVPTSIQEYQLAKEQGFTGTFQQWQDRNQTAPATPVSIQEYNLAKQQGFTGTFQEWKTLGTGSERNSNYSLMLEEAGIPKGTPEHQARLNDYTQSMIRLNNRDTTPTEAISILNKDLNNIPSFANTENDLASLSRVQATLPLLEESNPQAFTIISGAIPALYRNNSRAQSEIDNFRSRKGITEDIGDWLTTIAGGTATKETKENIKELINLLDVALTQQRVQEVSRVRNSYNGVIDEKILSSWEDNQLRTFPNELEDIVDRNLGVVE